MKLNITNNGTAALPISSSKGAGFAQIIEPGTTYSLDSTEATVVTLGESPSLQDALAEFVEDVAEFLKRALTFWRKHQQDVGEDDDATPIVNVKIDNLGTNDVRVILGDPKHDATLMAGAWGEWDAVPLYIELRELGV